MTYRERRARRAERQQAEAERNPIAAFAAALNPPAGALADALPFTLTPPPAAPEPDGTEQPDLFTEPKE